jgi:Raf kinase inhibitor-like YbhB/YbcL family protein
MLGRLLRNVRAGDRYLLSNDPSVREAPESMLLASPAFAAGASMPVRYAAAKPGLNVSPPLTWSNVPPGTAELLLVVEDPDSPLPRPSVHLVAMRIPPTLTDLAEGALARDAAPAGVRFGRGTLGVLGYTGPRPPGGHGPHRYVFQLLALRTPLVVRSTSRRDLLGALAGNVLARGRLEGTFER